VEQGETLRGGNPGRWKKICKLSSDTKKNGTITKGKENLGGTKVCQMGYNSGDFGLVLGVRTKRGGEVRRPGGPQAGVSPE